MGSTPSHANAPTSLCFFEHAFWSFAPSVDLMSGILAVEQPLYHPVEYALALFHHSKIFFARMGRLYPCECEQTLNIFRQEHPKSFPGLSRHRISISYKFNLNWELISFKICLTTWMHNFLPCGQYHSPRFRELSWHVVFVFCFLRYYYICLEGSDYFINHLTN